MNGLKSGLKNGMRGIKGEQHMVYTEDIMTADDIIEMYDGDLELIAVFREHGKLEELRDYI